MRPLERLTMEYLSNGKSSEDERHTAVEFNSILIFLTHQQVLNTDGFTRKTKTSFANY